MVFRLKYEEVGNQQYNSKEQLVSFTGVCLLKPETKNLRGNFNILQIFHVLYSTVIVKKISACDMWDRFTSVHNVVSKYNQ